MKKGDKDFSATVTKIKGASPDAVFYCRLLRRGRAVRAAAARTAASRPRSFSADGTNDPQFVSQAGEAAAGRDPVLPVRPGAGAFADEYTKKFSQEPGIYSVEGYDLTTILLTGIDSGRSPGPTCSTSCRNYDGHGSWRASTSGRPPVSWPPP